MTNPSGAGRPQHHRRRGAASLIEVVVMMSAAMVMLSIAMTTIHLLLRAEQHSTQAVWHNTNIARLSRVLRDDVHAARQAAVQAAADDDASASLKLTLDDDRHIVYTIEEHELKRVESSGETVERLNSFFLPVGSSLQFEQAAGSPTAIRLVIQRARLARGRTTQTKHRNNEQPFRRTLTIDSIVGRDHRFERSE